MKKSKKIFIIVLCVVLALIIGLCGAFFILRHIGKKSLHENDSHISTDNVTVDDGTVTYKNQKYRLNENIVTLLIMGVDKENINSGGEYGTNGQADCIFVAAIDTEKKTFTVIPVSRETMTDVEVYSISGGYSGVERTQLCLAYAYGKTPEESSRNVITAVKRMFYGLNISSYIAVDFEGLERFTELIGGVEVTSLEEVKINKKAVPAGEKLNLSGSSAVDYIRSRGKDLDANNRRMARQKQFLSALVSKTGNRIMSDFTRVASYYNTMQPYISTNISLAQVTYLASSCITADLGSRIEYRTVPGTMKQGEFAEFNTDEKALLQIIMDVFYVKVQ